MNIINVCLFIGLHSNLRVTYPAQRSSCIYLWPAIGAFFHSFSTSARQWARGPENIQTLDGFINKRIARKKVRKLAKTWLQKHVWMLTCLRITSWQTNISAGWIIYLKPTDVAEMTLLTRSWDWVGKQLKVRGLETSWVCHEYNSDYLCLSEWHHPRYLFSLHLSSFQGWQQIRHFCVNENLLYILVFCHCERKNFKAYFLYSWVSEKDRREAGWSTPWSQ